MNPITKIFVNIPDETLIKIVDELTQFENHNDMVEFKKVGVEVRKFTNSTTVSTDFLLIQTSIYKEAAKRFKKYYTKSLEV